MRHAQAQCSEDHLVKTLQRLYGHANLAIDLTGPQPYDPEAHFELQNFDWERLGSDFIGRGGPFRHRAHNGDKRMKPHFQGAAAAGLDCMVGPLAAPPRAPRKPTRVKAPQKTVAKEMAPDEVATTGEPDPHGTPHLAKVLLQRIKDNHGAPLVFFILDHDSFAQTVENLFALQTLLAAEQAGLVPHATWGQAVQIAHGMLDGAHFSMQKGENHSSVMPMNYKIYDECCKVVPRERCLTPHRPPIPEAPAQGHHAAQAAPSAAAANARAGGTSAAAHADGAPSGVRAPKRAAPASHASPGQSTEPQVAGPHTPPQPQQQQAKRRTVVARQTIAQPATSSAVNLEATSAIDADPAFVEADPTTPAVQQLLHDTSRNDAAAARIAADGLQHLVPDIGPEQLRQLREEADQGHAPGRDDAGMLLEDLRCMPHSAAVVGPCSTLAR